VFWLLRRGIVLAIGIPRSARNDNATFVREDPAVAVEAEAEEFATVAQLLRGRVVKRVHLVGARRDFAEGVVTKLLAKCFEVRDDELDFDFVVGGHCGRV
jgi:hypothetical protein